MADPAGIGSLGRDTHDLDRARRRCGARPTEVDVMDLDRPGLSRPRNTQISRGGAQDITALGFGVFSKGHS